MNIAKIKIVGAEGESLINENTLLTIKSGTGTTQRLDDSTTVGIWDVDGEVTIEIKIDKKIQIP